MKLRDYQEKTIKQTTEWLKRNPSGNPVVCLPGGSGKSVVIGHVVKQAMKDSPSAKILMMVGVKELILQNYAKLRELWPNAPAGIYSASLRRRDLDEPIIYGGIQSLAKKSSEIGHIDLCIIDECHAISSNETGSYRRLIGELLSINPKMRIIGYTASPYRLGQGLLTEGDNALFSDIIEPVSIEELVMKGYLCKLQSKHTKLKLDTTGVKKQGGDFIASHLQAAVDTSINNLNVVQEMIARGQDRKSWLVFCSGIEHAQHISQLLNEYGIQAECLTGKTPTAQRDSIVSRFKSNNLRCMVGVGVFTTGFDHSGVDLIAMLRPTMSPGLYLQCAVRGCRPAYAPGMPLDTVEERFLAMANGPKPNGCLVLDFAGVVETHGPITNVQPPKKYSSGKGEPPVKVCEKCHELVHISIMVCPSCGEKFPEPEKKELQLRDVDIMGMEVLSASINSWKWRVHISKNSGKSMLYCAYYAGLSEEPITEYFPILNGGYAGQHATTEIIFVGKMSGIKSTIVTGFLSKIQEQNGGDEMQDLSALLNKSLPPKSIKYKKQGAFFRVLTRSWT